MRTLSYRVGRAVLILCCAFSSVGAFAQKPPPEVQPEPSADAAAVVPLTQVPAQLLALNNDLDAIAVSLAKGIETTTTDEALDSLDTAVHVEADALDRLLESSPSLAELRDSSVAWTQRALSVARLQNDLNKRDLDLENELVKLQAAGTLWRATYDALNHEATPPELLERINTTIARIGDVDQRVQSSVKRLNIVEGRVAKINATATATRNSIAQQENAFQERLVVADSPPLWAVFSKGWSAEGTVGSALHDTFVSTQQQLSNRRGFFIALLLAIVVFVVGSVGLKRALVDVREDELGEAGLLVNFALFGLLLGLVFVSSVAPDAPLAVSNGLELARIVVVALLLPRLTRPNARTYMLALLVFFAGESVRELIQSPVPVERFVVEAFSIGGAILMWWLGAPQRIPTAKTAWRRFGAIALRLGSMLFAVAAIANVFGYYLLATVITDGVLLSANVYAALLTIALGFAQIVRSSVKLPILQSLAGVRMHGADISRWTRRLLLALAFLFWILATLRAFTIDKQVLGGLTSFLTRTIGAGTVSFTIGGLLQALLVLGVGYALANFGRFVLREEVLERVGLARGLPTALANGLYYVALVGIFLLTLGAAGVELSKLTVLTGAIGVGIGFGLQNVINNFVSGIIIQFERPIHINDVIEFKGMRGRVRRIGVRSSTIQTFDGAEVIVPNGNLVANELTNWTLSEKRRRIDIPIGVAYGTDLDRVMDLLATVAATNPEVLKEPAPQTFLMGFGESALNLELRFWAPDQDSWVALKSTVSVAVSRALADAGIEIPFPQREVRIRAGADEPEGDSGSSA